MSDEVEGYRKIRAKELSPAKQEQLRKLLQQDLAAALIRAIKVDPPNLNMNAIRLVLKPGQSISNWDVVSDCGTCATCNTCDTCNTCSTHAFRPDIPKRILKNLGVKGK